MRAIFRQFGDAPRGRLIMTDTGHMTGFVAASGRTPGHTDTLRADLHRSMIAYSGTYRFEADLFIVAVDLSWHASWEGTDQARTFRTDGD
ncbi:MAG: lipocalin-like domain-containing protein [Hyphomicrobiaceae bacterium]